MTMTCVDGACRTISLTFQRGTTTSRELARYTIGASHRDRMSRASTDSRARRAAPMSQPRLWLSPSRPCHSTARHFHCRCAPARRCLGHALLRSKLRCRRSALAAATGILKVRCDSSVSAGRRTWCTWIRSPAVCSASSRTSSSPISSKLLPAHERRPHRRWLCNRPVASD